VRFASTFSPITLLSIDSTTGLFADTQSLRYNTSEDARQHPTRCWGQGNISFHLHHCQKYANHPAQQSEEGSVGLPDLGDSIDALTFEQILEMDDDEDDREFSRSIVFGFFEQAEQTFKKMDDAL
jgi:hypothetical protein